MTRIAKAYITLVLGSGAAVLLLAARSWSSASLAQFLTLLGFAAVSSTLKVRIPGIESTLSPNFVFLLLSMLSCSFSEVMAITLVAALVQSLWAAKQPRLVQVAFSAAALVLSAAIARQSSYLLFGPDAIHSPVALVILAGSLYLSFNTAFVSAVIALVDGKPLVQVARIFCECVFPYSLIGIMFAGLASSAFPRSTVWNSALALFPIVVLGYLYSLSRTRTVASGPMHTASAEDDELVEAGSYRPRR